MKNLNKYYIGFAVLTLVYTALILLIPPDASTLVRYGISSTQAKLISLSVALPIILIWFSAFYGFIKFKHYAQSVENSKDGIALGIIAEGLMYLAIGLPVNTIINSILNYYAMRHPSQVPATVIINNYISLIIVLVAFVILYRGAERLMNIIKKREKYSPKEQFVILLFAAFSLVYCYVTLTNPSRQFPEPGVSRAAFYLPDWLIVTTIILPYLLVWFYGIRVSYYISLYRKRVRGVLYKQSLWYLSLGISAIVLSSMFVRFLVSLTSLLNNLSLKILLLLVYVLLLAISVGYILLAIGAKKLRKIEEV